ncbi:O-methyltransferase [Xanthomonas fragariae]|uniref:O-methyltransferase n=1 Tax=Xanthomonas fragariae TaxID=48664 RepID=A0A1Y6H6Z0_9XANT|nr:hypothetical protein PD885_00332 [Xanthomonas fragariae]SMR04935.1 O-methyltransferase [Xanthomonas fragariae]
MRSGADAARGRPSEQNELAGFGNDNDAQQHARDQRMLNITPDTGALLAVRGAAWAHATDHAHDLRQRAWLACATWSKNW